MQDLVIDWSKAPEGATHYLPERNKLHHPVWLKIEGGTVLRVGHIGSDEWSFEYSPDSQPCLDLSRAIPRPAPSWSGEGLPPVGMVCEVLWDVPTNKYYQAFVCGEDDGQAVYRFLFGPDKGFYRADSPRLISGKPCFRPIRTPEQIAKDEREAAIDQMVADTQAAHGWSEAFGMLHDKGYRKEQK